MTMMTLSGAAAPTLESRWLQDSWTWPGDHPPQWGPLQLLRGLQGAGRCQVVFSFFGGKSRSECFFWDPFAIYILILNDFYWLNHVIMVIICRIYILYYLILYIYIYVFPPHDWFTVGFQDHESLGPFSLTSPAFRRGSSWDGSTMASWDSWRGDGPYSYRQIVYIFPKKISRIVTELYM